MRARGPQSGLSDCPQLSQLWMVKWPGWLAKSPLIPSKPRRCAAAHKSPPPLFFVVLSISRIRSSLLEWAFASFTRRAERWPSTRYRCCVESWGVPAGTLGDQARVVLLAGWAAAWVCQGRLSGGVPWHPTNAGWGSYRVTNSSSISVSARQPAGVASLCP